MSRSTALRKSFLLFPALALLGVLIPTPPAKAGAEPFIGEISWFAGNFAPRGWAFCDGQLLPIAQNSALFSLLGTTYGGDGRTNFALPDMRGRVPMHAGNGPGLNDYRQGAPGGQEHVTLTENQMPRHTHAHGANSSVASQNSPTGNLPAAKTRSSNFSSDGQNTQMSTDAVAATGGGQAHPNMQPYLPIRCIIALQGLYPSRN